MRKGKFFVSLLTATVLLFSSVVLLSACDDTPVAPTAPALTMLSAQGKDIVDADGEKVVLRGTNLGGWLVQEGWMCPTEQADTLSTMKTLYSRFGRDAAEELVDIYEDNWIAETDFANIAALGLNTVRIPFTYMNIFNFLTDDGELLAPDEFTLRDDAFARLDWALEMCRKYGLYAILDLHGAVASQNGNDHSGDTSGSNLYEDSAAGESFRAKTAELWGLVAEHFEGNPYVAGYDLLNEPGNASGATQWDYYDVLYDTVRAKDADHMIFIEAVWDPAQLPSPSEYDWKNVVYEYHHYNRTEVNIANFSFYASKQFMEIAKGHGVPVLVGEFNAWGDEYRTVGDPEQTDLEAIYGVLEFYNGEGWHWTTWTYKVTVDSQSAVSTWGLYNCCVAEGKVNPAEDTYERIAEVWGSCSTEASARAYDDFADIVFEMAKAPFGEGAPAEGYSILQV